MGAENRTLEGYLKLPYHLAVRREQEGRRSWWSASVEELPGCAARGETPDEAVDRLQEAMETWLTNALAERRQIPMPSREAPRSKEGPSHSGRLLVRMSSALHEQLALAAERDHVSLNRFVTDALAASLGSSPSAEVSSSMVGAPTPGVEQQRPPIEVPVSEDRPAPPLPPSPDREGGSARAVRLALATNLVVVVLAGLVAVALLVLALEHGI